MPSAWGCRNYIHCAAVLGEDRRPVLFQQPLSGIARQDLQLRGSGEFLGARQSGVPMLRFADLEQDGELLLAAQATADEMLNNYAELAQRHIARWLGDKTEYLRV